MHAAWSVSMLGTQVSHEKNGRTDQDVVDGADLCGSKEPCIRGGCTLHFTEYTCTVAMQPYVKLLWPLIKLQFIFCRLATFLPVLKVRKAYEYSNSNSWHETVHHFIVFNLHTRTINEIIHLEISEKSIQRCTISTASSQTYKETKANSSQVLEFLGCLTAQVSGLHFKQH